MKKILGATIFCISVFAHLSCDQVQSNNTDPKTLEKIAESKEQTKTEETKTDSRQATGVYPNLKTQADEMGAAFKGNDYDKFADFMYPKIVEMNGGKAKFIAKLNVSMQQMKEENGVEIVDYEVGEPSQAIEIDKQVFSVLPTKTTMKIPDKTVVEQGSVLAVSEDRGNNWKFIRVESKEKIRSSFPNVVDKLTFPETSIK
ncbi:MAG: hypothetical protein M3Q99_03015 [Acidobacteriota bacterium]|nr:hypothetical protein [Acidobacteriota bacterium]